MFKRIVATITLVFIVGLSYATIYQWKNTEGVTVFSDKPRSGAKPVELPMLQTYPAVKTQVLAGKTTANSTVKKTTHLSYTKLAFINLENDAVIRNNNAIPFEVTASIEPALREGDVVELQLDNKKVASYADSKSNKAAFTLIGVERGEHHLRLRIVDAENRILLRSDRLRIYFLQSRQQPLLKVSS